MKTFHEAQTELRKLYDEDRETYLDVRRVASDHLSRWYRENAPEEGMGSSDVSCHLIEAMRTQSVESILRDGILE
jgi:hypothetical protein